MLFIFQIITFNRVSVLRGEKHYISLKIPHQARIQLARKAATIAKRYAPTIKVLLISANLHDFNLVHLQLCLAIRSHENKSQ